MNKDEGNYIVRRMSCDGTTLLNICDKELLGTSVKDGMFEMHISREYFGGELVNEEGALRLIRTSTVVNLVGSRIVRKVLQAKMASELAVKTVGSVSFLMIFKFGR